MNIAAIGIPENKVGFSLSSGLENARAWMRAFDPEQSKCPWRPYFRLRISFQTFQPLSRHSPWVPGGVIRTGFRKDPQSN